MYTRRSDSLINAGSAYASNETRSWVAVNPEAIKSYADELLKSQNVKVLYHFALSGADVVGRRIRSVTVVGKGTEEYQLHARTLIDATGDANL